MAIVMFPQCWRKMVTESLILSHPLNYPDSAKRGLIQIPDLRLLIVAFWERRAFNLPSEMEDSPWGLDYLGVAQILLSVLPG